MSLSQLPPPAPLPGFASPGSLRREVCLRARAPRRRSLTAIAEEVVRVRNPGGGYSGAFKVDTVPMMRRPMDLALGRDYGAIVFVGPAQTVKTQSLVLNTIAASGTDQAADVLVIFETERKARDFSDRQLGRQNRASPALAEALVQDLTLQKTWRNGSMLSLAPCTIGELSGRAIPRVLLPDYDRLPQDVSGEGSPFDLARKRNETFYSRGLTLAESSIGFPIRDPNWDSEDPHEAPPALGILSLFARGTRELWLWACLECGERFEPRFRLLNWPDSEDLGEILEGVVMVCPHCGHYMPPERKGELNAAGAWCAEGESIDRHGVKSGAPRRSDIASFWLRGPAAAYGSWRKLVERELEALAELDRTGSEVALKTTRTVDQSEAFLPQAASHAASVEAEELAARAETYPRAVVPGWVRFLTASVDVQATWFEFLVRGWGPGLESVIVEHGQIYKAEAEDRQIAPGLYDEDWDVLTARLLTASYRLAEAGEHRMLVARVCCDMHGPSGATARAYDYRRRVVLQGFEDRFFLCRGNGRLSVPRWSVTYPDTSGRSDRKAEARGEIPVLQFNTNLLKDELDAQLRLTEPGKRFVHLPDWLLRDRPPHPFYESVTAEVRHDDGTWHKSKPRNEGVDLMTMSAVAALSLDAEKIDWASPPVFALPWDRNPLVVRGEAWAAPAPAASGMISRGVEV